MAKYKMAAVIEKKPKKTNQMGLFPKSTTDYVFIFLEFQIKPVLQRGYDFGGQSFRRKTERRGQTSWFIFPLPDHLLED